jgi:hypothetical protein
MHEVMYTLPEGGTQVFVLIAQWAGDHDWMLQLRKPRQSRSEGVEASSRRVHGSDSGKAVCAEVKLIDLELMDWMVIIVMVDAGTAEVNAHCRMGDGVREDVVSPPEPVLEAKGEHLLPIVQKGGRAVIAAAFDRPKELYFGIGCVEQLYVAQFGSISPVFFTLWSTTRRSGGPQKAMLLCQRYHRYEEMALSADLQRPCTFVSRSDST